MTETGEEQRHHDAAFLPFLFSFDGGDRRGGEDWRVATARGEGWRLSWVEERKSAEELKGRKSWEQARRDKGKRAYLFFTSGPCRRRGHESRRRTAQGCRSVGEETSTSLSKVEGGGRGRRTQSYEQ
jgi:hypothetical protein